MKRLLCAIGRHVYDGGVNPHQHADGSWWTAVICSRCLRRLYHDPVPKYLTPEYRRDR